METILKLAINTYSELTGMSYNDVLDGCKSDGAIKRSVQMLMFMVAK